MTNREKYAEQILDIACSGKRFAINEKGILCSCNSINCLNCKFHIGDCDERRREWAYSEYIEKPKISETDRRFLDYLPNYFKYIARNENEKLFVYTYGAKKSVNTGQWLPIDDVSFLINSEFEISFPMVKWSDEEPWLIEDLKNLDVKK